jgi:hypothetical protein
MHLGIELYRFGFAEYRERSGSQPEGAVFCAGG